MSSIGPVRSDISAKPLERTPLRDQAVEVMRDLIIQGSLEAGTRINEVELASVLGISRGPLREAIQRLGAEGLIEFHRNRGAFVRAVTSDDIEHMYELRVVLESSAARWAASRATDEEIEGLRQQIREVDDQLHADPEKAYPIDADFHAGVLNLAKNPYLQRAGSELEVQLRISRLRSGRSPERAREALEEHREILTHIAARDGRAAAKAMTSHLRRSLSRNTPTGP